MGHCLSVSKSKKSEKGVQTEQISTPSSVFTIPNKTRFSPLERELLGLNWTQNLELEGLYAQRESLLGKIEQIYSEKIYRVIHPEQIFPIREESPVLGEAPSSCEISLGEVSPVTRSL